MNQVKSLALGSVAVALLALCVGCAHAHRVVNTGKDVLHDVTVHSGDREFGHGYLAPRALKGYSGSMRVASRPTPVVSWKAALDGERITREVPIGLNLWNREVVFELDGTTVKGSLLTP